MSGDVTYQALKRLSYLPERDASDNGNVIAGQDYDDVYFIGGTANNITLNNPVIINPVGIIPLANGGTGANLSATGGTSRVLRQSTTGAAVTVSQLAASDLSNGTTGSGAVVLASAPTLVSPALGTPTALVGTNITGTAAALTAGTASAVALAGVTGLGTGVSTFLATPTSANLKAAVPDETGSGALVFATSPTLVTPVLGAASATSLNLGGTTLSNYQEGTWTPIDASGAGLSFSSAASYTRIGNLVTATGQLTFATTASGATAQIGGLPFSGGGAGKNGGLVVSSSSSTLTNILMNGGGGPGTTFYLLGSTGAALTNLQLSGVVIYFQITYHI